MRVLQVGYGDIGGGAARAAYRLHRALVEVGVDSRVFANVITSGDWTVEGPSSKLRKAWARVAPQIGDVLTRLLRTENRVGHSPSVFPSGYIGRFNASDADVVHLHWVQGEMLSVEDIGRLRKPVVWTLHDMWAFCGAEHYTEDSRWRDGYLRGNRPSGESGFDLNRWTWERKRRHWRRPLHIVTPSHWLGQCARDSALLKDWPVTVVPNCLDTDRWQPIAQPMARDLLGLPRDVPLVAFGAMGGSRDPRKGFDLLRAALDLLRGELPELQLVVFGQLPPRDPPNLGFQVHYTGHLHDELSLRAVYSAADAMVIPSRQDNLPNTGVEALACATPVVAFDTCGLPDIVLHKRTGYLASAFSPDDLARGIQWVVEAGASNAGIREQARAHAVSRFSPGPVTEQYRAVYAQALAESS